MMMGHQLMERKKKKELTHHEKGPREEEKKTMCNVHALKIKSRKKEDTETVIVWLF